MPLEGQDRARRRLLSLAGQPRGAQSAPMAHGMRRATAG
jgi:hypothetical protein